MPLFHFENRATAGNTSQTVGEQPIGDDFEDVLNFANAQSGDGTKWVSADQALHNSDIYATVMQLSNDLAGINYKTDKSQLQAFVRNPSATANGHAFWGSVFAQLLLGGEAFVYRWRNVNGVDLRWEYLRPSQVQPFLLEDGSGMIYNANFDEPGIGTVEAIPASDMLHFRLVSQNGGMTAVSPLAALSNELNIKDANNRLTLNALNQSVQASGVLKVKNGGLLNAKEKAARSKQLLAQQNASQGGPIVLDDLEDYTPLEIKSNVAQLLSQTDWTSKQIAKVFGIPDSFLNGQGDQQSSLDQISGMYVKALNRYALAIVSELNDKLTGDFEADLWPVVDPLGSTIASSATAMTGKVIDQSQASWWLKQVGYLPDDLPDPKPVKRAPAPAPTPPQQPAQPQPDQPQQPDQTQPDPDPSQTQEPTKGGESE